MKAGVVAGLAALRALLDREVELDGEAVLLTVPSEEDGGAGMLAAIRAGYTADMAVITEPTRLDIVTAQAGSDHVPDHDPRPFRARRVPPAGRVGAGQLSVVHAALIEDERRGRVRDESRDARLGLPYPTNIGAVSGGTGRAPCPSASSSRAGTA